MWEDAIENDGFAILPRVFENEEIERLLQNNLCGGFSQKQGGRAPRLRIEPGRRTRSTIESD